MHAARLAVGLRAEAAGCRIWAAGLPEQVGQLGQCIGDGLGVVADTIPEVGRKRLIGGDSGQQLLGDAVEDLERALPGLIDALSPKDPRALLRRRLRELGEDPRLAPTRLRLEHDQPTAAGPGPPDGIGERGQFILAADEGRVGQGPALVVQTGNEGGLLDATREGGADLGDVGHHRRARLVPLAGVLAQQAFDDRVDGAGHGDSETAHSRRRVVQVLAEHLAHRATGERRTSGEALEQHDAERVEVGTLIRRDVDQSRLLGGHVARRSDRLVAEGALQPSAARETEIDEDGSARLGEDDVGRLHVAVQNPGVVGGLERPQHVGRHIECVSHSETSVLETFLERPTGDVALDDEQLAVVITGFDEGRGRAVAEMAEDVALVGEAQAGGRRHRCRRRRLDDDRRAVVVVHTEERVHAGARLQEARGAIPTAEETALMSRLCQKSSRLGWCTPPRLSSLSRFHAQWVSSAQGGTRRVGSVVDAVVVGSGPNGLTAAAVLAEAGVSVAVIEAEEKIGGGTRSDELTLPGFVHDRCSGIHPFGVASPAFRRLPLEEHGLEWVHPELALAHPLDDGSAGMLDRSIDATAEYLGRDGRAWRRVIGPISRAFDEVYEDISQPLLRLPRHPIALARFGVRAAWPATTLARRAFRTEQARGAFAGVASHSFLPLERAGSGAAGVLFAATVHAVGWPAARGGSQKIADALASYVRSRGGEIVTGATVRSLADLPPARAVLFDTSPRAMVEIAGERLPSGYTRRIGRFRHGPGSFKIDYALDGPVPWKAEGCRRAGTVHIGGTLEEVAVSERAMARGEHPERPYVLTAQQSLFDATRAPDGRHTLWAYCHVPNGSTVDMTDAIERQIERFAPGFRDLVLARHVMFPADLEAHNANYVGGDIAGGSTTGLQLAFRPVVSRDPYATPADGLYLCSASTPPGGGVHGMCGYWAAQSALKRTFGLAS